MIARRSPRKITAIAEPHWPGNERARLCQAKQTHWPTTGHPKRCAAGRVNRAMLATVAVHGCKSACAGANTLPKPPR